MNILSKFDIPMYLDDGRLDGILDILRAIKLGQDVELSFRKTERISPAGHAILFVMLDMSCEQKTKLILKDLDEKKLGIHEEILKYAQAKEPMQGFVPIGKLAIHAPKMLIYGKASSIAPEFIQMVETKFEKTLGEDRCWDVTLIINELMQNAVDHSTSERYFLYAGEYQDHFEFGILDMGVSIPAKMETKYTCSSDELYLEKAFEKEVGTRRNRPGGMGLYYLFEHVKESKGRLVIISRNAQARKNFGTRNYKSTALKTTLYGTWCMASIPLENK